MKSSNISWIIAGIICFITSIIHIVGGQLDLVNPLLESELNQQVKTELIGVWHVVTAILLISSYWLLKSGLSSKHQGSTEVVKFIGIMFIVFSIGFIISSLSMHTFAPQWIILLPIGVLCIIGLR